MFPVPCNLSGFCRYFRSGGTGIRTRDTTIFSRVLYQLSYPAEETWEILRHAWGAIKRPVVPRSLAGLPEAV